MRYDGDLPTQLVSITTVQPCEEKRRGERERGEGAKSLGSRESRQGDLICVYSNSWIFFCGLCFNYPFERKKNAFYLFRDVLWMISYVLSKHTDERKKVPVNRIFILFVDMSLRVRWGSTLYRENKSGKGEKWNYMRPLRSKSIFTFKGICLLCLSKWVSVFIKDRYNTKLHQLLLDLSSWE